MKTVLFALGATLALSAQAQGQYQFLYTETDATPVADTSVSFTTIDNFQTRKDGTVTATLLVKEIPASFKSTCYWNVEDLSDGHNLLSTDGKVSFSAKKTADSWLRVVILEDGTVENTAASSKGFRCVSDKGSVLMTSAGGYTMTADVKFGTSKSYAVHFGSVNSESDMGALTAELTVSDECTAATVTYDYLTNTATATETEWGSVAAQWPAVSQDDRNRGYHESTEDGSITFVFDPVLWGVATPSRVEVRGSFNGWGTGKHPMEYDQAQEAWFVTVPRAEVAIPGNSGQPEYKFVTNGSNYLAGYGKSFIPEGYVFMNGDKNMIVVFAGDDFDTIKANSQIAWVKKSVADFDLTTREGQEELSNFRCVPGTTALFRSYHPYKITKTDNATEPVRMEILTALAVEEGIKSDICLSENEENNLKAYTIAGQSFQETIPAYYQDIIDNGRVLYTGTVNSSTPNYNEVYYNPTGVKFGTWVKEIVGFINSEKSEAPYLIHCRLGTDRTGVFCATLAALCGADWTAIAEDYQKTNRMGLQEFRDYHILQYAFQKLLGTEDIATVPDVAQGIQDYFVKAGYLSTDDIAALKSKLNPDYTSEPSLSAGAYVEAVRYYDLQGNRLAAPSAGLVIRQTLYSDGTTATAKVLLAD